MTFEEAGKVKAGDDVLIKDTGKIRKVKESRMCHTGILSGRTNIVFTLEDGRKYTHEELERTGIEE